MRLIKGACYTQDLSGGWEWCYTHRVAFQHEVCPGVEKERDAQNREKQREASSKGIGSGCYADPAE